MQTWKAITMYDDGSICRKVYATIDGEVWGCIATTHQANPWADPGSQWEVAIEGEDEYSSTIAQTWYFTWQEAILANQVDLDEKPAANVFARMESDKDWLAYWSENFQVAGYSAPTGAAFYRPKVSG